MLHRMSNNDSFLSSGHQVSECSYTLIVATQCYVLGRYYLEVMSLDFVYSDVTEK